MITESTDMISGNFTVSETVDFSNRLIANVMEELRFTGCDFS